MSTTDTPPLTLRDYRLKDGLTLDAVARRLATALGEQKRSHVSVWKIEHFGTDRLAVRNALAEVYGVTPQEIEAAINATRKYFNSKAEKALTSV